eukprot:SAG11_NODE_892_length_6673_cov_7.963797_2_plen_170_part_00
MANGRRPANQSLDGWANVILPGERVVSTSERRAQVHVPSRPTAGEVGVAGQASVEGVAVNEVSAQPVSSQDGRDGGVDKDERKPPPVGAEGQATLIPTAEVVDGQASEASADAIASRKNRVHMVKGLKNRWRPSTSVRLSKVVGGTITYTDCGYALDKSVRVPIILVVG